MENESKYSMHEEHSYANMDFSFVYDATTPDPDESESRGVMGEIDIPDDVEPKTVFDEKKQIFHCNESMDEEKENITIIRKVSKRKRVCARGCRDPKKLFRVPLDKETREIWRERLWLRSLRKRSLVCDNHFSSNLFGGSSGRKLRQYPLPDWYIPENSVYISEECTQTEERYSHWQEGLHNCVDSSQICIDCNQIFTQSNQIHNVNTNISEASTQTSEHVVNVTPGRIFPGMMVYNLRTRQTHVCASIINLYANPSCGFMVSVENLNTANLDVRITDAQNAEIANWMANN